MKVLTQIKSWFSGNVIFEAEVEGNSESGRLGLAVKLAFRAGADLKGAVLRNADLRGADLTGAVLRDADLTGADLTGAVLRNADLKGAVLKGDTKLIGLRPILQIGPMGSRSDYFMAFVTNKGLYFRTGCFFGTLAKFRAALAKTHDSNLHSQEYEAALQLVFRHAELWTPKEETSPEDASVETSPLDVPEVSA